MAADASDNRVFEALLDEFLERQRQGEDPSLTEYCDRHPHLAGEIRDLFPALRLMENLKPESDDVCGRPQLPKLEQVAGYRILGEIARGGMGVVYEAEQESLGRRVALKVLPRYMAEDEQLLARFRREARAAARMHHTNIVPVFEVGQDGEHVFYAMQLIQGQGLDSVIKDVAGLPARPSGPQDRGVTLRPSAEATVEGVRADRSAESLLRNSLTDDLAEGIGSDDEVAPVVTDSIAITSETGILSARGGLGQFYRSIANIGLQTADALAYAHARRIIHRDIKPSNLLIDAGGVVWVTDFGLAKTTDEGLTHTGDVLGTIRYMSLERFKGVCDERADVYSLGATIYELLVLRAAFEANERASLIEQISTTEPMRPRLIDPRVPLDLEAICLKSMSKEPTRRYQTATELAADLQRWLDGKPIRARRVGNVERLWRWCGRNRAVAALSVLAIVLLLSIVGVLATGNVRIQNALTRETIARQAALKARQQAVDNLSLAEVRLAQNYVNRGSALCEQGNVAVGILWLARGLETLPDGQGKWHRAIRLALASWRPQLTVLEARLSHQDRVRVVAFSPDGQTAVTTSDDGTARLWYVETGKPICRPLTHDAAIRAAAFGPHGKTLLTGSDDGSARVWNAATGRLLIPPLRLDERIRAVAYAPDGRTVLTAGFRGAIQLWDAATGEPIGGHLHHQQPIENATFSPDSRYALTASWDGTARLWDAAAGKPKGAPLAHQSPVLSVAFSHDGQLVLTGGYDNTARLWSTDTGQPIGESMLHEAPVWVVVFSPDDQTILAGSADRTARLWDTGTLAPKCDPLLHQSSSVRAAAFSPDGTTVLTGSEDHTARLWDATTGLPLSAPCPHHGVVRSVAFSPDGSRLLTGSFDGSARIWRVPQRESDGLSLTHDGPSQAANFSPDGLRLLTSDKNDTVHLSSGVTGETLVTFPHSRRCLAVAFSSDGSQVFAGGYDQQVTVWDAHRPERLGKPLLHPAAVHCFDLSQDDRFLLTGCRDHTVWLWDLATRTPVGEAIERPGRVYAVAFSPDGSRFATAGDDQIDQVYDTATKQPIGTSIRHQGMIQTVRFSPDGSMVLTGSYDRTARLWDAKTGRAIGEPLVHGGPVSAVAFSPDAKSLLTGTYDGQARLWDATTGIPLGPPQVHRGIVRGCVFTNGGRRYATIGEYNTVKLGEIPSEQTGGVDHLVTWTQVVTGMQLDAGGRLQILDGDTWQNRREKLASGAMAE